MRQPPHLRQGVGGGRVWLASKGHSGPEEEGGGGRGRVAVHLVVVLMSSKIEYVLGKKKLERRRS